MNLSIDFDCKLKRLTEEVWDIAVHNNLRFELVRPLPLLFL
jgi:hypothetical protein